MGPTRLLALFLTASVFGGCDSATEPRPAFDLVDRWVGTFTGEVTSFALDIRIETQVGERLTGTATAFERLYALEGRYAPPVVYLRMESPIDTLSFVGEMEVSNLVSGTLLLERPDDPDEGHLVLGRR